MLLKDAKTGDLVEVQNLHALFDPNEAQVDVRFKAGEEVGDIVAVDKTGLEFPSTEALPKCWLDPHYRIDF